MHMKWECIVLGRGVRRTSQVPVGEHSWHQSRSEERVCASSSARFCSLCILLTGILFLRTEVRRVKGNTSLPALNFRAALFQQLSVVLYMLNEHLWWILGKFRLSLCICPGCKAAVDFPGLRWVCIYVVLLSCQQHNNIWVKNPSQHKQNLYQVRLKLSPVLLPSNGSCVYKAPGMQEVQLWFD